MEKTLNASQPNLERIKLLQEYFEKEVEVLMVFLALRFCRLRGIR